MMENKEPSSPHDKYECGEFLILKEKALKGKDVPAMVAVSYRLFFGLFFSRFFSPTKKYYFSIFGNNRLGVCRQQEEIQRVGAKSESKGKQSRRGDGLVPLG